MSEETTRRTVTTKQSPMPVDATVARFLGIVSHKGLKVFAVVDQRHEAAQVGLALRDTVLVLFGDPRAGTPVMDASPLVALDLPLKILIWSEDGRTRVTYEAPASLATRHHLTGPLATAFDGIDVLTDLLVAPG